MQCGIFVLKWYVKFNATSPGKGLYPGSYARETLLGMLDCGDIAGNKLLRPASSQRRLHGICLLL